MAQRISSSENGVISVIEKINGANVSVSASEIFNQWRINNRQ
jgi:hypothetical protein